MKSIALIPAYCPGDQLAEIVQELKNEDMDVVVVNDGSPAEFNPVFEKLKDISTVLENRPNGGKGAALKKGLAYIQETYESCAVVTVDADGQHLPGDAKRLVDYAGHHTDTLVLGMRDFDRPEVPARSLFGNRCTEKVFWLATGRHIHDTQTGLRAFHSSLIPFLLNVKGDRYEYEMNVLLECVRKNIETMEVEIETVYEGNNECSHFNALRDSFLIYRQILTFAASSLSSFVIDYVLFALFSFLLKGFSSGLILANVFARFISGAFNYEVNRRMVFEEEGRRAESAVKYILLAMLVLAMNTCILYVLADVIGIPSLIAKVLTEVMLFAFSWSMQKTYVFAEAVHS